MNTDHLYFSKAGKTAFPLLMLLFLFSCSKPNNGPAPDSGDKGGYTKGKVVDAQGNSVAGAKILLDNTLLYASYITTTTDEDGNYNLKMPTGDYGIWKAYGSLTKEYHGKTYTLDLHPDNTNTFDAEGAVRNFTWKLTGKVPDDEYFYYGGSIRVSPATGSIIPNNNHIVIVIEPDGPLIDGSEGEMLTMPFGDEHWRDEVEIKDIPIGRYKAIAIYHDETGDYLLKLRSLETDGSFQDILSFDFEPESRWGYKNTVSLEFHE